MKKEICICAAILCDDGVIIRGHRHGDCLQTIHQMNKSISGHVQGFVTSNNRFVSREEGRKLQEEAGIKSADKDGYRYDTLFSEDLY